MIITNGEEYLREHSDVFSLLAPYKPHIYLTECQNVSITLCGGKVLVQDCAALADNTPGKPQE